MMKLEEFLKAGNRIAVYKIGEVPIIKKPILRCDLLKSDMSEACDNGDPMIGVRIADAKQYIQKTAKPPAFLRLRDIYRDFDLDEKLSNETYEKIDNKMDNEKIYTLRGLYDYLVMHHAVNFKRDNIQTMLGYNGLERLDELADYLLKRFCLLNGFPNVIKEKSDT